MIGTAANAVSIKKSIRTSTGYAVTFKMNKTGWASTDTIDQFNIITFADTFAVGDSSNNIVSGATHDAGGTIGHVAVIAFTSVAAISSVGVGDSTVA